MMNTNKTPLLSICIPTYNRANDLDLQIQRVLSGISTLSDQIEVLVLNNASPDNTREVIEKYTDQSRLTAIHNSVNIGLAGNYLKSIESATGKFIWVLGDDDPFEPSLIGEITAILKNHPDLNVLHLNHKCTEGNTGEVIHEKYYSVPADIYTQNGLNWVNENIRDYPIGGLMFISANIFNRRHAGDLISRLSPQEKNMQAIPLFIILVLGTSGPLYFVSDVLVVSVFSKSSWLSHATRIQCYEVPYLLLKSQKYGLKVENIKKAIDRQIGMTFNPLYFFYHLFKFGLKKTFEYNSINLKKIIWKYYFTIKSKHI